MKTARAYSAIHDAVSSKAKQPAKYPASNFTDVTPAELNKEKFDILIMQAGSVDITNLNTKENPLANIDYFKQEAVLSARNFFSVGVNALNAHPELRKVVLMEQTPRYDPLVADPHSLKQALSQLFNDTLAQLRLACPLKDKIFVGSHSIECSGSIREARYRHTKSGRFDGIHLYGSSGMKAYTRSVLNILRSANLVSDDVNLVSDDDVYHLNCPQSLFQQKRKRNWRNRRQARFGSRDTLCPDDGNHGTVHSRTQNMNHFDQHFAPTHNRFDVFSDFSGNF